MHIDTFVTELEEICSKGQIGASMERVRKIRKLLRMFKSERAYPWYVRLVLWIYEG